MLTITIAAPLAVAAGLAIAGMAIADQLPTHPMQDGQAPPIAGKPDPTLTPREISEREQEYLAALKKCEPLEESQRQECINALRGKYGLM
jgi:hypothetical protein